VAPSGRVAQLAERAPEKREVTGSTPVPTTCGVQPPICDSQVANSHPFVGSSDSGGVAP
jgi:hypothetical protein